jgi:ABC-2 type transport system permease protein
MSEATLAVRQLRFTNRAFWRNPASAFFTFAFPLMFLVIFTSLLGGDQLTFGPPDGPGELEIKQSTYYVVASHGVRHHLRLLHQRGHLDDLQS